MTTVSTKVGTHYSVALSQAGKHVAVHMEKADKSLGKYQDHMDTAGAYLVSARTTCKEEKVSFTRWMSDHNIGKTRAYQILKVADGTMTQEELLQKNAKAQRDYQKKLKANADKAKEQAKKVEKEYAENNGSVAFDVDYFIDFVVAARDNHKKAGDFGDAVRMELEGMLQELSVPFK